MQGLYLYIPNLLLISSRNFLANVRATFSSKITWKK